MDRPRSGDESRCLKGYCSRQLQHLVSDPICQQCMELFQREQRQAKENSGAGGLCATAYMRLGAELSYQRKAEKAMADENCFKIYIVRIFKVLSRHVVSPGRDLAQRLFFKILLLPDFLFHGRSLDVIMV